MAIFGSALILAGGKSQRMGFDKQLLQVQGTKLTDIILAQLRPYFDDILVSSNHPAHYEGKNVRVIPDFYPGMGPLAGIHAALRHAKHDFVFVLACDMPCVSTKYIQYMQQRIIEQMPDACVTQTGEWIEPFHAFYAKSALPVIESDLSEQKASIYYFLKKVNTLRIDEATCKRLASDKAIFLNLNTREVLQNYLNSVECKVF